MSEHFKDCCDLTLLLDNTIVCFMAGILKIFLYWEISSWDRVETKKCFKMKRNVNNNETAIRNNTRLLHFIAVLKPIFCNSGLTNSGRPARGTIYKASKEIKSLTIMRPYKCSWSKSHSRNHIALWRESYHLCFVQVSLSEPWARITPDNRLETKTTNLVN